MKHISETMIICVLFLVQFIDVLDFMVVMPLGPDFSIHLNIPESKLGYFAGSYTIAAAITGILSSTFIDRFERRKLLIFTLLGLFVSNLFSANAWNFESLLASRFIAGAFGGPATSVCFAIISDLFEEKKRGAAMGKIMGGFSLAAVFGVPIGLELSERFGWYSSFYFVALLCAIAIILVILCLPKISAHLEEENIIKVTYKSLLSRRINVLTFIAGFIGSMAAFMIIPYITAFVQLNLNFPREQIQYIFLIGGVYSFFAMRVAGKMVDKYGSTYITLLSNIFVITSLLFGFVIIGEYTSVLLIMPIFMLGMAIRNVSTYTLYSKVPALSERAGFMSIVSCVQHLACSVGSILASLILVNNDHEPLQNINIVVIIAIILFLIVPYLFNRIERSIKSGSQAYF